MKVCGSVRLGFVQCVSLARVGPGDCQEGESSIPKRAGVSTGQLYLSLTPLPLLT